MIKKPLRRFFYAPLIGDSSSGKTEQLKTANGLSCASWMQSCERRLPKKLPKNATQETAQEIVSKRKG